MRAQLVLSTTGRPGLLVLNGHRGVGRVQLVPVGDVEGLPAKKAEVMGRNLLNVEVPMKKYDVLACKPLGEYLEVQATNDLCFKLLRIRLESATTTSGAPGFVMFFERQRDGFGWWRTMDVATHEKNGRIPLPGVGADTMTSTLWAGDRSLWRTGTVGTMAGQTDSSKGHGMVNGKDVPRE